MNVKEYKIFKTAAKTAKENNLILKDKENIFDFSLLDSMEISDHEKEYIKEHDIKYVSAAFRESFYGTEFDNFSACIGKSLYYVQKVFSETTGKLDIGFLHLQRLNTIHKKEHMYMMNIRLQLTENQTDIANRLLI